MARCAIRTFFGRAFLDQAHAREPALVAGKRCADDVEEAAVDLVDDFELARQHHLEPGQRPLLQRLGQQRVVRVGERALGEVPRLVPPQLRVVQQDAHQLGHGQRGMRVVELNRDLVGQRGPVVACGAEPADRVRQRAGDEKVLLEEAKPFALGRRVVRIEHARERFGGERFGQRAHEIAAAELLEVEVVRRRGGPEAQRVDRVAAEADDRPVVGKADERGGPIANDAQRAGANVEGTAKSHLDGLVGPRHFPGVGPGQPVIRLLVLPAVAQRLLEDAVLVAQARAHSRDAERRHRVEEAGRQPAEAAVAEAGVGLLFGDLQRVDAECRAELADDGIEHQVGDVVGQRAAHQELERHVIDALGVPFAVGLLRS